MCKHRVCSSGHILSPSSSPRPRTSGHCPRRLGALRCHPGTEGQSSEERGQEMPLCQYPAGGHRRAGKAGIPAGPTPACWWDRVPPAHLACVFPSLQVPGTHHPWGQVALVHLVAVADLVVNQLHLGLPQLRGRVICKAGGAVGRGGLHPPAAPGPSAAPGTSVAVREEDGISCRL